jgi:CheY-like chemotaxis protein
MKILVMEDDENKRAKVSDFLQGSVAPITVEVTKSLQSCLRALVGHDFDLVILDMSVPTFDIGPDEPGGRPQPFGGREVLRQMGRRGISVPVVVLTQFDRFGEGDDMVTLDALDAQLRTDHPKIYRGSVYYNVSTEGWKEVLMEHLISVLSNENL